MGSRAERKEGGPEFGGRSETGAVATDDREIVKPVVDVFHQLLERTLHPVTDHHTAGGSGKGEGVVAVAEKVRPTACPDVVEQLLGSVLGTRFLNGVVFVEPVEWVFLGLNWLFEPMDDLGVSQLATVVLDELVEGGPVLGRDLFGDRCVGGLDESVRTEGLLLEGGERVAHGEASHVGEAGDLGMSGNWLDKLAAGETTNRACGRFFIPAQAAAELAPPIVPGIGQDRVKGISTIHGESHPFGGFGFAGAKLVLNRLQAFRVREHRRGGFEHGHGLGGLAQKVGEIGVLGEDLGIFRIVGEEGDDVGRVDKEMAAARATALHLGLGELGTFRKGTAVALLGSGEVGQLQESAGTVGDDDPSDSLGSEARLGGEVVAAGVIDEVIEHQPAPPCLKTSGLE